MPLARIGRGSGVGVGVKDVGDAVGQGGDADARRRQRRVPRLGEPGQTDEEQMVLDVGRAAACRDRVGHLAERLRIEADGLE